MGFLVVWMKQFQHRSTQGVCPAPGQCRTQPQADLCVIGQGFSSTSGNLCSSAKSNFLPNRVFLMKLQFFLSWERFIHVLLRKTEYLVFFYLFGTIGKGKGRLKWFGIYLLFFLLFFWQRWSCFRNTSAYKVFKVLSAHNFVWIKTAYGRQFRAVVSCPVGWVIHCSSVVTCMSGAVKFSHTLLI